MADLRDLLTELGFVDGRSLLQSGNLVFRSPARTGAHLERLLEAEAEKRLGLQTDFFVRTTEEWVVALRRLVDDEGLRAMLGAAGRARAIERFSIAVIAPQFAAALRDGATPAK